MVGRGVDSSSSFGEVSCVRVNEVEVFVLSRPLREDEKRTAEVPENVSGVRGGTRSGGMWVP